MIGYWFGYLHLVFNGFGLTFDPKKQETDCNIETGLRISNEQSNHRSIDRLHARDFAGCNLAFLPGLLSPSLRQRSLL